MFRESFLAEGCSLTSIDVQSLIAFRNAYDYPRAYMRFVYEPTRYPLVKDVWAEPVHPVLGSITDSALDEYHRKLLNSATPLDNLLGTMSAVFWGFYTWGPEIALIRADRHLFGYKSKPATTPELVADAFSRMHTAQDIGEALGTLAPISQLGRMPFGSKVVALRYPSRAGIKDTQIYKGLASSDWAKDASFLRRLGGVQEPRCQRAYSAWCEFLSGIANQLNAGINTGEQWHWASPTGEKMCWRAVDVERALFKYYLLRKGGIQVLGRSCAELQLP